jgi:cation diffusion facilitator family transporter
MTAMKVGAGLLSGSVSVLSEGIHSGLDLVSATIAFFTVRVAGQPADVEHPFGHGKIETLSSLVESLLLIVAAGFIIWEGFEHLYHPTAIQHEVLAMVTIGISLVISWYMYRHNSMAAVATESSAIQVNALHFLSDVVAAAGVLIGLVLMKLTGWLIIDPIMAFAVAGYIIVITGKQVKKAIQELSDTTLPEGEINQIKGVLEKFKSSVIEAHDLRTRKSGATRHIDFHLVVCGQMSVNESHAVCDRMELALYELFPRASVNIHVEPCEHENTRCMETCPYKAGDKKGNVLK